MLPIVEKAERVIVSNDFGDTNLDPDPRDPFTRFHSGFDRWCRTSLEAREITCRMSGEFLHSLDHQGNVWYWHHDQEVWWLLTDTEQSVALRDSAALLERLPTAVRVVRLYVGATIAGEREAARQGLGRIGRAIWEIWGQFPPIVEGAQVGRWISSPTEIYDQVTRNSRWVLTPYNPPLFDDAIHSALSKIEREESIARARVSALAATVARGNMAHD
jgi:hypothetical protein